MLVVYGNKERSKEMDFDTFYEKIVAQLDALFCPFDGVWCERSSCRNCRLMREQFEAQKEKEG